MEYSPKNLIETDHFYYLENLDNFAIFFLGNDRGIQDIKDQNKLCNIEKFTDTSPIFDQTFLLKTKPEVFHPINQNIHLEWLKHRAAYIQIVDF